MISKNHDKIRTMEYLLQIISNTFVLGSLYAILALGFNFIYSANKFFDLSYASYLLIGTYSFLAISKIHFPIIITFIFAVFITVVFSLVVEIFLYRGLRKKKSSGAVMMISSLGILTVVQALIALIFTSNVETLSVSTATFTFFGVAITYVQLAMIIFTLSVYVLGYFFLSKSTFGIQLRAVSDNEELAMSSQLPIKKVRIIATCIGVAVGTTSAILYAMDTSLDPYVGMNLLLKGVIVAILGGLGNFIYGLVGAFILATLENLSIWYVGGEWKDAVAFFVLIMILLFRPSGLLKK